MASVTATPSGGDLPGAHFVTDKLHRAWRKERRFHHTRGLCYLVLWALAMVLLDLLVDFLFRVPGYWRLVLVACNVGVIGWVVWHHWLRHLRRYDAVRTALQVEGRHPELQSLLVSFVQFGERRLEGSHISPSLVRALQRQTIEYTQPIDFREIISYRELKRIFLVSALVVAFFGVVSVNWSQHLRVLFYRLLNPAARVGYPTRTRLLAVTGHQTIQQGTKVAIQARAAGLLPRDGTLYVRPEAGAWENVPFPRAQGADDTYSYEFSEVYQTFRYRIRLGDVSSEEYQITVVPPPRIVGTSVRLEYPEYTGLAPQTLDILNLEVPEGTKLLWELRCDQALASAAVLREGAQPIPMQLEGGGRLARFEAVATESFDYSFRWNEKEHGYEYKDEVRYFVQVIPDSAPQVEILRPLEDEKATTRKTLSVQFQARDDYGLADAAIVYTVNDGEEQRSPLGGLKGRLVEREATWTLKQSIPSLKEGDVVTYLIEVADNHSGPDGAFKSRSQGRRLYIVSVDEYLRYLAERRRKLVGDIRTMHQQETEATEKVGEIDAKAPPAPPTK